jgi:hypothetical protein
MHPCSGKRSPFSKVTATACGPRGDTGQSTFRKAKRLSRLVGALGSLHLVWVWVDHWDSQGNPSGEIGPTRRLACSRSKSFSTKSEHNQQVWLSEKSVLENIARGNQKIVIIRVVCTTFCSEICWIRYPFHALKVSLLQYQADFSQTSHVASPRVIHSPWFIRVRGEWLFFSRGVLRYFTDLAELLLSVSSPTPSQASRCGSPLLAVLQFFLTHFIISITVLENVPLDTGLQKRATFSH